MSRTIQLRNVPDALYRKLKARADMVGMSLPDYLLSEIREIAKPPTLAELRQRPTLAELQQRIQQREPVTLPESAAAAVRAQRDAR
jgi:antitoxin FitA